MTKKFNDKIMSQEEYKDMKESKRRSKHGNKKKKK